jgi:hypothetical protein
MFKRQKLRIQGDRTMSGMKRWTALLVTAVAMMTMGGCKTTVVNKDVPTPDHHDDHRDDHRPPPPPRPDRR